MFSARLNKFCQCKKKICLFINKTCIIYFIETNIIAVVAIFLFFFIVQPCCKKGTCNNAYHKKSACSSISMGRPIFLHEFTDILTMFTIIKSPTEDQPSLADQGGRSHPVPPPTPLTTADLWFFMPKTLILHCFRVSKWQIGSNWMLSCIH